MWIKAGMLLKMMLKSLLKSLQIIFKSDALTFFYGKKRVFKVITYHTAYPLRIISKGKDLEKMSYGND